MMPVAIVIQPKPAIAAVEGRSYGKSGAGQPFVLPADPVPATADGEAAASGAPNALPVEGANDEREQSETGSADAGAEDSNGVMVAVVCVPPAPGWPSRGVAGGEHAKNGGGTADSIMVQTGAGGEDEPVTGAPSRVLPESGQLAGNKVATQTGRALPADAQVMRSALQIVQQQKPAMQSAEIREVVPGEGAANPEQASDAAGNRPESMFRARLSLHTFKGELGATGAVTAKVAGIGELIPGGANAAVSIAGQVGQAIAIELASDEAAAAPASTAASPDIAADPATIVRQLSVRLNPDHLGEVRITMAVEADGTMLVTLAAAERQTGELFRQSTGELVKLLHGHGVDVKSVTVVQPDASQFANSMGRQADGGPDFHQAVPMNSGQGQGAGGGHERAMDNRQGAGNAIRNDRTGNVAVPPRDDHGESGAIFV